MLYALVSVLYWLCLYVPLPDVLQPALTVIDFAPRWLVFTPLIGWLLIALVQNKFYRWWLITGLTIINVLLVVDWQLPSLPRTMPLPIYSIATYNAGGNMTNAAELINWYQQQQLDALLLQEARAAQINSQLPNGLQIQCYGQLCVLTQHQLSPVRQLTRKELNGYGTYAAHYQLNIQGQTFSLVNLHLNTPRHGLQMLKAPRTNYRPFLRLHADIALESMIASQLTGENPSFAIVGGDFNLTQQSQVYRRYWRDWQNSFQQVGTGLGYTKTTTWHGVRIDHILLGDQLQVVSSEVHPSMGSDHKPLVVRFGVK